MIYLRQELYTGNNTNTASTINSLVYYSTIGD